MIISILNEKGGVGKTTIAINLAYFLSTLNQGKVLLVDADKQASISDWSRQSEGKYINIMRMDHPSIEHELPKQKENYSFIIVDGPGSLSEITKAINRCTDVIIIPVTPGPLEYFALEALIQLIKDRQQVNMEKKPPIDGPKAAFLINRARPNLRIFKRLRSGLMEYDIPTFSSNIIDRITYAETIEEGRTIYQGKDKKAKEEFRSFVSELEEFVNEKKFSKKSTESRSPRSNKKNKSHF